MPLDTFFSQSSRTSIPRSRSFLSKFAPQPFAWNRNVSDFCVELVDPWKTYFPGDVVKGTVILTVTKPIRITHLRVCLHGHAQVFKHQVVPGERHSSGVHHAQGGGKRSEEYFGNGFISLFEEEVILCGDGRLAEGIYKFEFELSFPSRRLPSSIDFERGTVCYAITSTLTRNTTILPTLQCDKRVNLLDSVDIAQSAPTKSRVISLEPVSKRGKVRARVKSSSVDKVEENINRGSRPNTELTPAENSLDNQPPLSPSPSEMSSASAVTASTQSFRVVQRPSSANGTSVNNSENRFSSTPTSNEQTIDANIELLKPGALPGETVLLRILVNHVKQIRGTIIVTLYRQGRIDMRPTIPIVTRGKTKQEYEDIYPRSKTGLGGLHFSAGSASTQFRKDLTQSFTPMIVNPQTMTADVKASIRVPEDAFPTMDNIPGNMILFKYYVEVVIDVCGKLGESRILPRFNMTSNPSNYAPDRYPYEEVNPLTMPMNERVIDTDQMRRTKSIVHCHFELTVGSRDTNKASRKWPQEPRGDNLHQLGNPAESSRAHSNNQLHHEYYDSGSNGYSGYNEYDEYDSYGDYGYHHDQNWLDYYPPPLDRPDQTSTAAQLFPPPNLQSEDTLDEKSRLRRQEELLLPSRPPGGDGAVPSSSDANAPSAPFIDDLNGTSAPPDQGHAVGRSAINDDHTFAGPSNRSVDTVVRAPVTPGEPPPAFGRGHGSSAPQEDKQEMERQRLIGLASAPPVDGAQPSGGTDAAQDLAPSAPVFTEEDEYHAYTLNHDPGAGDNLPEYRR